jgi:hypothetical protein
MKPWRDYKNYEKIKVYGKQSMHKLWIRKYKIMSNADGLKSKESYNPT